MTTTDYWGRRQIDYGPSEAPDVVVFRQTRAVSKRGRKCSCGQRIPPGVAFVETSGTEDGVFFYDVRCGVQCHDCGGAGPYQGEMER